MQTDAAGEFRSGYAQGRMEAFDLCMKRIGELEEAVRKAAWQPIGTAPRDQTPFLASCHFSDGERTHAIIRWDDEWRTWVTDGVRFILNPTGDEDDDRFPTHWMPLPSHPKNPT